jgi:NSS family neurotransmitter:Na+ symporter
VGKKWKFDLKYILPAMLIVMWIIGVGQLIYEVDLFKLGIYVLITFLVLVLSVFFTRLNPIRDKE